MLLLITKVGIKLQKNPMIINPVLSIPAGESPFTIDFSDPELILPGANVIALRVDPSLDSSCPRRPRQRMNFDLPDIAV